MANVEGGEIVYNLSANDKDFNETLEKARSTADKVAKDIDSKFSAAAANIGKSMKRIGDDIQDVGRAMITLGAAPALALAGASKAAIDFESSFAGVRKTVDLSEAGFQQLSTNLRDLAKRAPVDVNDLNRIAELAGQLGVSGVDNLSKFTETITKFTTATGISGEVAASSFARIANIMQEPIKNIDRMGSVVAQLGDSSAATEGEILEFSERIAGAGKIAGLSTANIFSIGAAMASVGVEAEAGGTAVQKVLISMYQAAQGSTSAVIDNSKEIGKNSEKLKDLQTKLKNTELRQSEFTDKTKGSTKAIAQSGIDKYKSEIAEAEGNLKSLNATQGKAAISVNSFAKVLGITSAQFTKLFKQNPEKIFEQFVLKLGEISKKGGDAAGVLEDLELGDQRLLRAFLSLSNAGGLLTDQIQIGNKEWGVNNRLNLEAQKRYATTASQIQIAKNNLNDLGITIGSVVLPVLNKMFTAIAPILSKVVEWAEQNPKLVAGVLAAGAAIGVIGIVLVAFGAVIGAVGTIVAGFGALMAVVFAPITLLLAGLAVGVGLLYLAWTNNFMGIQNIVQNFVTWFQSTALPAITGVFKRIGDVATTFGQIFTNMWNVVVKPALTDFIKFLDVNVGLPIIGFFDMIGKKLGEMGITWQFGWDGMELTVVNVMNKVVSTVKSAVNSVIGFINGLITGANSAGSKIPGYITINPLQPLAKGTTNFSGGMALVGERGPELVNLPRGSDVFSNRDSQGMLGGNGFEINIAQVIVRDQSDIESIGREIGFRIQTNPGFVENG